MRTTRSTPAPRAPRASGGAIARATLLALALSALGVFHIWTRTRVVSAGYELGALQKRNGELMREQDRLRLRVETLRSPRPLADFARARLGMAPPARGAVWAAGPRDTAGRAGVDGVGHPPRPAEPSLSTEKSERAAAGLAADPGAQVALRGPLRAGRAAPRGR